MMYLAAISSRSRDYEGAFSISRICMTSIINWIESLHIIATYLFREIKYMSEIELVSVNNEDCLWTIIHCHF